MKILIIAAHMDDEVLGCGGTILKLKNEGHQVYVLYVCSRAYENKVEKVTLQREENCAAAACKILGVDDFWFLKLRDEQLDHRVIDVTVPIEEKLKELRPDVIFTNHRGDNNQDHRSVFDATMIATRGFAEHSPKKIYTYEVLSSTEQSPKFQEYAFLPTVYVDIKKFIEKKIEAFKEYKYEMHLFPHPRSPESIIALAQYRGISCNLKYAEAFMLIKNVINENDNF